MTTAAATPGRDTLVTFPTRVTSDEDITGSSLLLPRTPLNMGGPGAVTIARESVDAAPATEGIAPERNPAALVALLADAWRHASTQASTSAALTALVETATPALYAKTAAIVGAAAASPGPSRRNDPRTLEVPIVGSAQRQLASLLVERGVSARPFSPEDEAIGHALGQIAAIVIEGGASKRNLLAVLEHAPAAIFLKDHDLRYVLGNRRAAEMLGLQTPAEMIGHRDVDFLPRAAARRIMASDQAILDGEGDVDTEEDAHWPLVGRRLHVHAFSVRDDDGKAIGVGGVVTDITDHRLADDAVMASERRYRLLLENALDAIVITDDDGRTVQVNPACSTLLGWSRAELLAQKVADLIVDPEDDVEDRWREFLSRSADAPPSRGYLRLRRKDGTTCEAEYSSVANVEPGIHLGVLRDATERRQSERLTHQRHNIRDALASMPTTSTLAALADAACAAMVVPGGFAQVAIMAVESPSRIAIVGVAMDDVTRAAGLPPIVEGPPARAIIAKAMAGAWVDDWTDALGLPSRSLVEGVPIAAVAWAPIQADGRVIALLVVGGPVPAIEQERRLPSLVDLASLVAASTLGRSLREHSTGIAARTRIRGVLEEAAYHAVFQPLVDLESRHVVGYEALTRFTDGTRPDAMFAEAASAGMSIDIEIATARAAFAAAAPLPANLTINLNVSPEVIMAGEPLRTMLREWGFGVVLEITEHSAVSDYDALRAALADLGPSVRLAVDDAGAGFASLRHILELRPSMVKLDLSLIRGIDSDPARQALVAGMVHFANRLSFDLLAEGVETEAERATLLELGVTRAQGYLFGRPVPVAEMGRR